MVQEQPPDPTQTMPFPDALLQVGWVVQVRAGWSKGDALAAVWVCMPGPALASEAGGWGLDCSSSL